MLIFEYRNYRVKRCGKRYFVEEHTGMAYRVCYESYKRFSCVMWILEQED